MRSRGYIFTLNNFSEEEVQNLQQSQGSKYLIFGKEVGENGTPHLQGYIYFKNKKSFKQVKGFLGDRYHIEAQRGSCQQAIDYCKKDGDYQEIGTPPLSVKEKSERGVKRRREKNQACLNSDLLELVENGTISINEVPVIKKAKLILQQEGDAIQTEGVRGEWYWGPPGVGKSHLARTSYPKAFIKSQNKWWDGYKGQKEVILDDLDTPVLGHFIKIWADKWKSDGEVKGGTVALKHEKFVVTSNYHPSDLWKEDDVMAEAIERRFKITHFTVLK